MSAGDKGLVTLSSLEDIADAIRGKLSSSDTYTPGQMAGAIESIPSGGGGASILSGTNEPTAAQGSDGNIYIRTCSDLDVIGTPTSDTPTNAVISASSYYGNYNPYKGFGEQELGWMPNGANGSLMVEFSSTAFVMQKLSFNDYMTFGGSIVIRNATTEFQGSNDGVTWDTLYTKSNVSAIAGQMVTVTLNTDTPYSKFRFVCTGYGSNWSGLRSIVLSGYDPNETPDKVLDVYVKASGAWQPLIGSDISDVGGVTA